MGRRIERSRSYIAHIENGARPIQALRGSILVSIAKAYEEPVSDIMELAEWPQLLLFDLDADAKQEVIRHIKNSL